MHNTRRGAWMVLALLLGWIWPAPSVLAAAAGSPALAASTDVSVEATSFKVRTDDGRLIEGTALEGAVLSVKLPDSRHIRRIRLDRVVIDPDDKDGDLLLYRVRVLEDGAGGGRTRELCNADSQGERWAFPLAGQWDRQGRRLGNDGFTLACAAGGALGKCVRWGYKPWRVLPDGTRVADYHAACVRMVRADYCGDRGTTRNGMLIDLFDAAGINSADDALAKKSGLTFEAAWSPEGAVCVAHTRVPSKMTLKTLARTCPRLLGHLGEGNCIERNVKVGQYRTALIFNRSRPGAASSQRPETKE